jgi:hypothetical protein
MFARVLGRRNYHLRSVVARSMIKLALLNPEWDNRLYEIPPRRGVGIWFDCPTCPPTKRERLHIWFSNPLDGGPSKASDIDHAWTRSGTTFETLTIAPSIDASACKHWHGFITNGDTS